MRLKEVMERKKLADSMKAEIDRYALTGVKTRELKEKKRELDLLVEDIMQRVAELEDVGAIVRDIDLGLVDFQAERFGDKVYLCWKYGENDVNFWHATNEGFSGRKQLKLQVISP